MGGGWEMKKYFFSKPAMLLVTEGEPLMGELRWWDFIPLFFF